MGIFGHILQAAQVDYYPNNMHDVQNLKASSLAELVFCTLDRLKSGWRLAVTRSAASHTYLSSKELCFCLNGDCC